MGSLLATGLSRAAVEGAEGAAARRLCCASSAERTESFMARGLPSDALEGAAGVSARRLCCASSASAAIVLATLASGDAAALFVGGVLLTSLLIVLPSLAERSRR